MTVNADHLKYNFITEIVMQTVTLLFLLSTCFCIIPGESQSRRPGVQTSGTNCECECI